MGCFLIMTDTDFRNIRSSMSHNVTYLSRTASGIFIEVRGDTKPQTKQIASEIRARFPKTTSDNKNIHHLIPQQFEEDFLKLGIDIHDYGVPIASRDHIGKSGMHNAEFRYNKYWETFLEVHEGQPREHTLFWTMLCIKECTEYYKIDFDTTVRYGKEK